MRSNLLSHGLSKITLNMQLYLYILDFLLQFAEARRHQQIEQLTKDRKQQHYYQMVEWKKRFIEKQNEATRRVHEDNVKHLQVSLAGVVIGG